MCGVYSLKKWPLLAGAFEIKKFPCFLKYEKLISVFGTTTMAFSATVYNSVGN